MRRLAYLAPVVALLLKRHAAAALWQEQTAGILPWHVAMVRDELLLAVLVAGILFCAAVLTWNYVAYERPLNKRTRP